MREKEEGGGAAGLALFVLALGRETRRETSAKLLTLTAIEKTENRKKQREINRKKNKHTNFAITRSFERFKCQCRQWATPSSRRRSSRSRSLRKQMKLQLKTKMKWQLQMKMETKMINSLLWQRRLDAKVLA